MALRYLRRCILVCFIPLGFIVLFYLTSFAGAILPAKQQFQKKENNDAPAVTILLVSGPIHYDLLLPATPIIRAKLHFLTSSGFDVFDPKITYFSIGWGSKAFYTSTKDYTDLEMSTIYRAVAGDASVMRIFAIDWALPVAEFDRIKLSQKNYSALVDYVEQSFSRQLEDQAVALKNANLGRDDMFFESPGHFNLIKTCNVWIANGLNEAGVKIGRWTPTPQSLRLSLWWFDSLVE